MYYLTDNFCIFEQMYCAKKFWKILPNLKDNWQPYLSKWTNCQIKLSNGTTHSSRCPLRLHSLKQPNSIRAYKTPRCPLKIRRQSGYPHSNQWALYISVMCCLFRSFSGSDYLSAANWSPNACFLQYIDRLCQINVTRILAKRKNLEQHEQCILSYYPKWTVSIFFDD